MDPHNDFDKHDRPPYGIAPATNTAYAAMRQQRDDLMGALQPFVPGFHNGVWGRIKAFIVNGAPTRDEGISLARQITEWQAAIPESVHVADGDRVPPFQGTDAMDGDENLP